jgi:hypothetical protein
MAQPVFLVALLTFTDLFHVFLDMADEALRRHNGFVCNSSRPKKVQITNVFAKN